jgi:hypothetical protein
MELPTWVATDSWVASSQHPAMRKYNRSASSSSNGQCSLVLVLVATYPLDPPRLAACTLPLLFAVEDGGGGRRRRAKGLKSEISPRPVAPVAPAATPATRNGVYSGSLHFFNAPHINNRPLKTSLSYQIKTEPSSRAMAEASFGFQMADRQTRRIVTPTCENHNQFCVASLLVSHCGTC